MPILYIGVAQTEVILAVASTALAGISFAAGYLTNDLVSYIPTLF